MSNDIVVIGAGVIGVCAAYELAKSGHRVTLVDQGDVVERPLRCGAFFIMNRESQHGAVDEIRKNTKILASHRARTDWGGEPDIVTGMTGIARLPRFAQGC